MYPRATGPQSFEIQPNRFYAYTDPDSHAVYKVRDGVARPEGIEFGEFHANESKYIQVDHAASRQANIDAAKEGFKSAFAAKSKRPEWGPSRAGAFLGAIIDRTQAALYGIKVGRQK